MTTQPGGIRQPRWWGWVGLMGLFAGLCTIFALIVTAAEAWQEHAQAQWPEVTARIQQCRVEYSKGSQAGALDNRSGYYYIVCRISYLLGTEEIAAGVHSRSAPAPNLLTKNDPWAKVNQLQSWVDAHPRGKPIAVHYDPANHRKAVLVATDMPLGGPRSPANLRLLGILAAASVVLLTIARIARPPSGAERD